jgi:hypothetical protein
MRQRLILWTSLAVALIAAAFAWQRWREFQTLTRISARMSGGKLRCLSNDWISCGRRAHRDRVRKSNRLPRWRRKRRMHRRLCRTTCKNVKLEMLRQDLGAIAKEKGLSRDDPELEAKCAAAEAESVHEIEALLGPDALASTREYTRLDSVRRYVAAYAGLFSRIGEPMSFDQVEALTAAIGKLQTKSTAPGNFTSAEWARVSAEAQRVLTPAQWREFQVSAPPDEMGNPWQTAAKDALAKAGALEKN